MLTSEEISVAQDAYMEGSDLLLGVLEHYFYLSFYGDGFGYGGGFGYGYSSYSSYGDGFGYSGFGDGIDDGFGYGDGFGEGTGDGFGDGFGYGDGFVGCFGGGFGYPYQEQGFSLFLLNPMRP